MKALFLLVAAPPNDLLFSSTRVGLTRRGYCGLWPKTEKTTQTITTPTKPAVPSYHLSTHPHNSTTGLLPFLPLVNSLLAPLPLLATACSSCRWQS